MAADVGPRVFVCCAHGPEAHKERVRQFVSFLRAAGIDATMDAWNQEKRRDWSLWAIRQISLAGHRRARRWLAANQVVLVGALIRHDRRGTASPLLDEMLGRPVTEQVAQVIWKRRADG